MAQLVIRDLDRTLVERLRKRARRNGRTLQAEAKQILEEAAVYDALTARRVSARIRKKLSGRKLSDSANLVRRERRR